MFAIDENFIPTMIDYVGSIFGGTKLLVYLIAGLYIGFFILESIIDIIGVRLEKRAMLREEEEKRKRSVISGILKPYKAHREAELRKEVRKELIKEA